MSTRQRSGPARGGAPRSAWFEVCPDGVLLFSGDGRVSDANREACRLLGRGRGDLLGLGCEEVFDASDPRFSEVFDRRGRAGESGGDLILLRGDGSTLPVEVSFASLEGGFGASIRQVGERQEAQARRLNAELERREANRTAQLRAFVAELQESEERFRASFEQAAVGIAHVSLLSRWTRVNGRLCGILGYSQAEMLRLGFQEVTHPEDLDADFGRFKKILSGQIGTYSAEKRYIRKDGREIWVNQTLSAVREASGLPAYFICVVEDITDRKLAEETLRESEERFRSLVQNTSDIISVCAADGTILYESPSIERVLGYRPQEMIGKNAYDYVHPEDLELARRPDSGVRKGQPLEFRCRHKDGTWRHVEVVYDDLLDNPAVRGIVISSRDVTGRREADEALRRSVETLLALNEAGQVLGSTLELEKIGSRLLEIMRRVTGLEAAVISYGEGGQSIDVWRSIGPEELWRTARGRPEVAEARLRALRRRSPAAFRIEDDGGIVAGVCLALRVRNRTAGMLEAYGPQTLLETGSIEVLESLANQAASALENARLYREVAEREARLKDLVGKLLNAQEEERRRVAYEVHDGLTQVAVSSYQHLQAFAAHHSPSSSEGRRMLQQSLGLIRRAVQEARQVIAGLRPTVLDDFGLETALRLQVEELNGGGARITFSSDLGAERLPVAVETSLYRVAQEALTNVRKHAGTASAGVRLERGGGGVMLEVEDRGGGFDAGALPGAGEPGRKVGLSSMRERVELVGGSFEIRSAEGAGTTVTARVPLAAGDPPPTRDRR